MVTLFSDRDPMTEIINVPINSIKTRSVALMLKKARRS
jgi:hypothetical protein